MQNMQLHCELLILLHCKHALKHSKTVKHRTRETYFYFLTCERDLTISVFEISSSSDIIQTTITQKLSVV